MNCCKKTKCKCNTSCSTGNFGLCQSSKQTCITRYKGPDIDCIGITEGDTFETVIGKMASFVCNLVPPED